MKVNELQSVEMNNILELADSIINKKYLSYLTNSKTYLVRDVTMNELATDINKHCRVFHLKKFIYDTNENFLQKLITVVNVAYALKGTIVTAIKSDGEEIDFYIAIVAKKRKGEAGTKDREALLSAFEGTISGNFGGSIIDSGSAESDELSRAIKGEVICSVTVVPSLRNTEKKDILSYVQGIENLVDSLKGKKYVLLTIADPVDTTDISEIRHGYENIYNYLAPLYKVVETKGSSETINLSQTETENYVKGITESIARTQGKSESVNYSNGFNLGVSFIASAGFNHSKSKGTSISDSTTSGHGSSEQFGKSRGETTSLGNTVSDSSQISIENRIIKSMLDKIEKNLARIDECEGYGAFNSATYVLADNKETALNVAGNFISLMKGEQSSSQSSGINCWEKPAGERSYRPNADDSTFRNIMESLKHFSHPTFVVNDKVSVSTSTMVSGPELTVQLGFPKKSVNGLVVLPMHPFGRNVCNVTTKTVSCGSLYFMGKTEKQEVSLDINSLASHTFVTGSTGTGKSNVIYGLLAKLNQAGIPYMVVEPAKGEYKNVFGKDEKVKILGTNRKKTDILKINPFAFNDDVHVLEHIDRLIEVFNVCWSMYAAMPAVLKEAVENAYVSCGWDLNDSSNLCDENIFPTFADLENSLVKVIENSAYDEEVKSNYKGALLTRIKTLTNGINGQIFCSDEIPEKELFDTNVIIDLSRVGAMDTKSLIMGILVIRLQEYRMSCAKANSPLRHVTVLEEAHNLLKKTSSEQSGEGVNLVGKSVEMLAGAIAEMRTYGEGFIIADQAPGLMDTSVIRNTNTKIVLRTPEYNDRMIVGKASNLDDGQIDEIAKLPVGVAAIYQNNWLEPVLCQFEKYEYDENYCYYVQHDESDKKEAGIRTELIKWMLSHRVKNVDNIDYELIAENIDALNIPSYIKVRTRQALSKNEEVSYSWKEYKFDSLAEMVVDILKCKKEMAFVLNGINSSNDITDRMTDLSNKVILCDNELFRLEVNHCIMKVFSKSGTEELKKYYEWNYHIRNLL